MTAEQYAPTPVQVLAARLRVKADKRLQRESPEDIRAIAESSSPAPQRTAKTA